MRKQNRLLLAAELVMLFLYFLYVLSIARYMCVVTEYIIPEIILSIILIFAPLFIIFPIALEIETYAGFYKCKECGHIHVPTTRDVCLSIHFGWTRKMKCPKCNKKTWQKKILDKND